MGLRAQLLQYLHSYVDLCLFNILPREAILNYTRYFQVNEDIKFSQGPAPGVIPEPGFIPLGWFETRADSKMLPVSRSVFREGRRVYDLQNQCSVETAVVLIPEMRAMVAAETVFWGRSGRLEFPAGWAGYLWRVGDGLRTHSEAVVANGYQIIPGIVIALSVTGYSVASGNFQVRLTHWATGGLNGGSGHFEYVDLELGVVVLTLPVLQRCQTEAQFRHKSGSVRFLKSGASRHLILDAQEVSLLFNALA